MEIILINLFITLIILYLSLYYLEINIREKECNKILVENININKDVYKNIAHDYIKKTNDFSLYMNNPKDLNVDTSFINPNLSFKNARSNFELSPFIINPNEKEIDNKILQKIEKQVLKKTFKN